MKYIHSYIDIFTNTEYLTEEETIRILKELNSTYLKEV